MEVLSSYTAPLDASPYSSPRTAVPSSSLLDCRSSRQGLDPHSELALSVDRAIFVNFNGDLLRPGVGMPHGPPRRSTVTPRTFAPLTPIIASPITTPTTSMSTTGIYSTSDKEGAKEKLTTLHHTSHREQDYLTKGMLAPMPASEEESVRVVDRSPTWISTPPTPPSKPPQYRSMARRASSSVPPSASLPTSSSPHAYSSPNRRRRASLPPMALSKPLPPTPLLPFTPSPPTTSSLKGHRTHQSKEMFRLSGSPLRDDTVPAKAYQRSSSKPIFHIPDSGSDEEEDGSSEPLADSPKEMFLEQRLEAEGKTAISSENNSSVAKKQDDIRRYHALTELLSTEEGYLMDLRELIHAYTRQLPTLSRPMANSSSNLSISPFARSPVSATFMPSPSSSNSRPSTHSQLPMAAPQSSLLFPEGQGAPPPSKDRNTTQYMFSDDEIELVTRNIEEILNFHEVFVDELRSTLIPLGFSIVSDRSQLTDTLHSIQKKVIEPAESPLEAAIVVVSKMFTRQAAHFELYESFCAGHTEALDLVRKLQQAHTVEWDAFEQRSSQLIVDMRKPVSYAQTVEGQVSTPAMDDFESFEARRKRRHSLSSLDVPRPLRIYNMRSNTNLKQAAAVPPDAGASRDNSRLVFMDYLIKPVQRICKYPLLLDQLKPGRSFRMTSQEGGSSSSRESTNTAVETASQAMRHVASSVDEARRRQDILTKSSLIAARISNPFAAQSSRSLGSLSHIFLSSLGACLLAGSMDVIHHYVDKIPGSSGTVKAKYLGAFLYMGGYLILVKVSKGKVYEPRHWFSLVGFELIDVSEEDALLPCSFRLSCKGHHFDMAAACQREKDVWISAFRESLTLPSSWSDEPVSSLQAHGRSDFMVEEGPSEGIPAVPPLPTIQSIPELQSSADASTLTVIRNETTLPRVQPRPDSVNLSLPPSRRSSTASVKAIFLPAFESTILIRRSSPPARLQVERGLRDVFSDICLSARFHANTHEEELFQAPKVNRSGFSRSSSGLGMAGMGVAAKNRLTKRESVIVQRRTSCVDPYVPPPEEVKEIQSGVLKRTSTAKSLANRGQTKKLKIVSIPLISTEGDVGPGENLPVARPALSQCSSVTASNHGSATGSPVIDLAPIHAVPTTANTNLPRQDLLVVHEADYRPKRSRSMVDNVKYIFQSRSTSPASSDQSPSPSLEDSRSQWNGSLNSGLFKWWPGTLRRRARSTPGPSEEIPPFASGTPYSDSSPPMTVRRTKTAKERRPGLLSTSESGQLRAYTSPTMTSMAETHFQQKASPVRQRLSFSSTTSSHQINDFIKDEPVPSSRLHRNFSFLQRLNPFPATMTTSSQSETV